MRLKTLLLLVLALALPEHAPAQAAPNNVRVGQFIVARGSGRSLLSTSDLTWVGMAQAPHLTGIGNDTLQGSDKVDNVPLASYYVTAVDAACDGQRRFLWPNDARTYNKYILSISNTNPAVVTTSNDQVTPGNHNLLSGQTINIWHQPGTSQVAHDSSPSSDGVYTITRIDNTTFSIPLDLSGGTAGTTGGTIGTAPATHGDFVEYCFPAGSAWYTGTNPTLAPTLHETRRWAGQAVTKAMNVAYGDGNGNLLGGLYRDDTGVLWINQYGYYDTNNMPQLQAVQLLDTADPSIAGVTLKCSDGSTACGSFNYKQVGTAYGPWWFYDSTPGAGHTAWKKVNHGFAQIPPDQRANFGGRDTILCGTVGAVGGTGNFGVGLTGVALPPLSLTAYSLLFSTDHSGFGLDLADYTDSAQGGWSPFPNAAGVRRDTNYDVVEYTDHLAGGTSGLFNAIGGRGFWGMSLDQSSGCLWPETTNVEGVLSFGRQVSGHVAYAWNPVLNSFKEIHAGQATESGNTVTVNLTHHNMTTGDTMNFGCMQPSGYNGNGKTVTVIDADHLTYTSASTGMATATYSGGGGANTVLAGDNTTVINCDNTLGTMIAFGWGSTAPSWVDQGRDNPSPGNGYSGQNYDVVLRLIDPAKLRRVAATGGVAAGGTASTTSASPYNDNINWQILTSLYNSPPAGWHIPPYRSSGAGTGATSSRLDQLSGASNAAVWDKVANQIVWLKINSNNNTFVESGQFTPTLQIIGVR